MFNWLRGGRRATSATAVKEEGKADLHEVCGHLVIMPRWDALEDMGKAEKATGYKCDACGQDLTRQEGGAALEHGARLFGS